VAADDVDAFVHRFVVERDEYRRGDELAIAPNAPMHSDEPAVDAREARR